MFDAANNGNAHMLEVASRRVLNDNYTDGMGHFFLAGANAKLGHPENAAREKQMADAIFASIRTGDGLSYEHAFTAIAIYEEYDLFVVMHLDHGQQSLRQSGGHTYDTFETKDSSGKPVTYYFNIDRVWAAEMRVMRAGAKP